MVRKKAPSPPSLNAPEQQELAAWIAQSSAELPEVVKNAFLHYTLLLEGLSGSQRSLNSILEQLRRALGIIPSSERRKNSGDPIGPSAQPGDPRPKNAREKLCYDLDRLNRLSTWHRNIAKKQRSKAKDLTKKLMKTEDIVLSAQEEAEVAQEHKELMEYFALGEKAVPALESPREAFMRGADVKVEEEFEIAQVAPALLEGEEIVARLSEERTRYGFNISIAKVSVQVEKVVVKDDASTRIISASTREIGPAKMDVTWEFLANMAIMVAQYAMPFNRLGSLLTTPDKTFTSASLSRMFAYVAQRFAPVYLYNFNRLANATILSGDDTANKVIEFTRFMKGKMADPAASSEPPWHLYATREAAEQTIARQAHPSLGVLTARNLGFEFARKDGNGAKKSLQTTLLWGRGENDDPRSTIVFYRSHIGGFGNLLSMCIANRNPDLKHLIVQSDLSSVNLISDPILAARFTIEHAGCASHARRPFALYENDDPDLTERMLHLFKGLYINEKGLDLHGRNEENVRAVRTIDSRRTWEEIKEVAEMATQKWSKSTKLGEAAHYILRHYKKLTAYLDNSRLSISNDFSERLLRMEKLIQANAFFRNSIEGRFALDINRSILQTAIAAHAPILDYVTYVLRASPDEVEANPEAYTALAYTRSNPRAGADQI